ncbi:hypothetical protein BAUCODRAFT_121861 [Baudoinia panamericana UAMH 10762]|uniref:Uncharacterized protein n=1 Tax=Baudoinia panamericana (strain UAMH 10762) TaxID=717646 RepID=M2NEL0_BAUPA|nr:uncharacterized protein BAUCODRAFT_121861 [Baudoinia panamericana UAMH 10762]EMC97405.1 hypothetical protein BAUCODRAFT_121861 [Baudoinia panamericana UAMH 10762]
MLVARMLILKASPSHWRRSGNIPSPATPRVTQKSSPTKRDSSSVPEQQESLKRANLLRYRRNGNAIRQHQPGPHLGVHSCV